MSNARAAEPWERTGMSEELWVIERTDPNFAPPAKGKDDPGQGELRARLAGDKEVPVPLEHTDVKAAVSAFISTVSVVQRYKNPYDTKIEAVYVFPLPENAAVTDFVMTVGERRIRGVIREREEAKRIYEDAKKQGYVASLLTQERPNIFTQKVANIEPGKRIDVTITYFSPLKYREGEYEFVFPMVVGPRFNPAGSTEGVGAVPRGAGGSSGQATEVQYLKPGERSGHDIAVAVDIDAGVAIEGAASPSHAVEVKRVSPSRISVALSPNDRIPNKDFVLRYRVAGRQMKTAVLTNRGEKGGHIALVLQPPAELADLPRVPREMVFVLDCSGSMSGQPIAKAKEATRRCLRKLGPDDSFQIITFSMSASAMGKAPVQATPENVAKGVKYLDKLEGEGGTMMIEGIRAALDFPHDENRLRIVSFMTDGYIGNESEILAEIKKRLGPARIFSFGVGNAVNRYLIEEMARTGRGAAAFVGLTEGAGDAVDLFYDRAARAALTDISVDWGGLQVSDVYPRQIPDLFVGRPVLVVGRFTGSGATEIRVSGRAAGKPASYTLRADTEAAGAQHPGVSGVWARWKIAELSDRELTEGAGELRGETTAVSIENRVLCRYTAFLAVDSLTKTSGDHGVTVPVPVPVPEGVRYETTVK
ncbi:MAG TPA: VIT domain-containing protein [Planctomycetota bacterium]|nr:VIT domain-containing protein [Planctomycetota bacterium]